MIGQKERGWVRREMKMEMGVGVERTKGPKVGDGKARDKKKKKAREEKKMVKEARKKAKAESQDGK